MVDDYETDADRIATLLRAEIENRETGGLDRLTIGESEAICDADGVFATLEPTADGLVLSVRASESAVRHRVGEGPLFVIADDQDKTANGNERVAVTVPTAAAVKRALDLLVSVAAER